MLQKKRPWLALLIALAMCTAAIPAWAGAGAAADPRDLYTEQILKDVAEYNALSDEDKCGVFVDLIDLDFDGWPELYVAFLKQGQWRYAFAERAYTLREGAVLPLKVEEGGLGLLLASEHSNRHQTYLVRDPADGGQPMLLIKYTHNEGSYDFGLAFYALRVMEGKNGEGKLVIRTPLFGGHDLPEALTTESDEAIQAFFDQRSEEFLSAYTIVATGADAGFTLENEGDGNGSIQPTREEIFASVSLYSTPKGL